MKNFLVTLAPNQLEALETQLERQAAIKEANLNLGFKRDAGSSHVALLTPDRERPSAIAKDIMDSARRGVRIAPQTESHPLIPFFEDAGQKLPTDIKIDHDQLGYTFYIVEVFFNVLLPKEQFPLSAEVRMLLKDDIKDASRKIRPIRLFPDRKDITHFKVDLEGAFGLEADLNFTIPAINNEIVSFKQVKAQANLKANFIAGPFNFQFRKAALEVGGIGDQNIFWRYNIESQLYGTNVFKSILILKLAEEAKKVNIDVNVSLVPAKRSWLIFKQLLPELTDNKLLPLELAHWRSSS